MPMNIRAVLFRALSVIPTVFSGILAAALCWCAGEGVGKSFLTGVSVAATLQLIFSWTVRKPQPTSRSSTWIGLAATPFALYLCGSMLRAVYLMVTYPPLREHLLESTAMSETALAIVAIVSLTWACAVAIVRVVRSSRRTSTSEA